MDISGLGWRSQFNSYQTQVRWAFMWLLDYILFSRFWTMTLIVHLTVTTLANWPSRKVKDANMLHSPREMWMNKIFPALHRSVLTLEYEWIRPIGPKVCAAFLVGPIRCLWQVDNTRLNTFSKKKLGWIRNMVEPKPVYENSSKKCRWIEHASIYNHAKFEIEQKLV
jgi:hypothetical protein